MNRVIQWGRWLYSTCVFAGIMCLSNSALAEGGGRLTGGKGGSQNIGSVASTVTGTLGEIAKLITAAAYVAGFGLAMIGIIKLKAHKDNPTQIPLSTGIALLFIGAALIFLPTIFSVTGTTLFGTSKTAGSVSGVSSF